MTIRHFSNRDELNEYLSSPRRNRSILNHVRHCERCQKQAREQRLARLHRSGVTNEAQEGHIDPRVLLEFCAERLNDGQMMQVMDHLTGCAICVAALEHMHHELTPKQAGGNR